MSCLSPLKAFQLVDPLTGELSRLCFSKDDIKTFYKTDYKEIRKFLLPCGQCSECRSDRAHKWADRLCLEASVNPGRSWFVTLTYDDEHLPRRGLIMDRETGVVGHLPVVDLDHVSSFVKRLRSRLPDQEIRFFAAAEYGDISRRPHYHIVLFCDLPDLQNWRPGVDGAIVMPPGTYFSQIISDTWNQGGITVQEANSYAMYYVAGYAVKKLRGRLLDDYKQECAAAGVGEQPPEGARMSRRPGIGVPALERENLRVSAESGSCPISTPSGSRAAPTPRVFERYLDAGAVDTFKERRAAFAERRVLRTMQLRPDEYLEQLNDDRARARVSRARVRQQKI